MWDPSSETLAVHTVPAGRWDDGLLSLERRIVGVTLGLRAGSDLVMRIEVDGREIYFGKAKRDQALDIGVQQHDAGTCFYIDEVEPPE